jgi:hypothetical protein
MRSGRSHKSLKTAQAIGARAVDGYAGLAGGSGLIGSIVPLSGRFDFAVADQGSTSAMLTTSNSKRLERLIRRAADMLFD